MDAEDEVTEETIAEDLKTLLVPVPEPDVGRPEYKEETYPIWNSDNTRMISGPIGDAKFPGRSFPTWGEARTYVYEKYTPVKFWCMGFRWFARIRNVSKEQ